MFLGSSKKSLHYMIGAPALNRRTRLKTLPSLVICTNGGSRISQRREHEPQRWEHSVIILANFYQNLHEIEKKMGREGRTGVPPPSQDPPPPKLGEVPSPSLARLRGAGGTLLVFTQEAFLVKKIHPLSILILSGDCFSTQILI